MLKHKKTNKQHSKTLGDVTINDFANADVVKTRQKKSTSNVTNVIKQNESDKAWDEIDDFENCDFVREVNEDGTYVVVLRKQSHTDRKSKENCSSDSVHAGNSYPLDIWFLISEYIRPQDVGKFAGICKASYAVVCSAKFWFSLYKRYYKYAPSLPHHLAPEHIVRFYGLRTSVIRALHFMYPPFCNKYKTISSSERHPVTLINKQCMTAFHKQGFESIYCFKFKDYIPSALKRTNKSDNQRKPNVIEMLEDVTANPDENCCVLLVNCKQFIPIPCVEGFILKSALLTLSQGFRHHRLQLGFSSGVHNYSYNAVDGSDSITIILDPVLGVKVLDWWDPQYPYNHNMKYSLADKDESDEDELGNHDSLFSII
ncbi:hypothetical protein RI129_000670 [Pyrocoelia pectoralis]|uniref:Transmembrane protein 183 n=1 Tax=Pyrocoelia pectoralis TaxID=417401 RepID=A0AAN7ZW72_9COLE